MTWQSEVRAWAVASAAAFCMGSIGYRVMSAPKLPDVAPVVAHLDGTLQNLNAATGAWSKASDQQVRSMSAIQRDIRAELWHVDRLLLDSSQTLQAARGAIDTANGQLTHVAPLLDSARAAVDSVTPAVQHADGILTNADGAVTDFRRFMTAPAITDTMGNVASMTQSGAAILADGRQVSDKIRADYLKPVPWYLYPVKKGSQVLDIGAAVARHVP